MIFLLATIILFFINIVWNNVDFFILSVFFEAFLVLVYVRMLICRFKIRIICDDVIPIRMDGKGSFTVTCINRGILPAHIRLIYSLERHSTVEFVRISPLSQKQVEIKCDEVSERFHCEKGVLLVMPIEIMCIFSMNLGMHIIKYVSVPAEYETEQRQRFWAVVENETGSKVTTRSYDEAPVDVAGYRKFQQGDRLKDISAKISLKRDEMYVKEYFYPEKCEHYVILEFDKKYKKYNSKNAKFNTEFFIITYNSVRLLLERYKEVVIILSLKKELAQVKIKTISEFHQALLLFNENYKYNFASSNIKKFDAVNINGNKRIYVISQKNVAETQKLLCSIRKADVLFYQIPFESDGPERFRGVGTL